MGEDSGQRAMILSVIHDTGRTQDVVSCPCGKVSAIYRWSWAGHGKARCSGCRGWIDYRTLHVTPSEGGR
jgi:hypothetical protein